MVAERVGCRCLVPRAPGTGHRLLAWRTGVRIDLDPAVLGVQLEAFAAPVELSGRADLDLAADLLAADLQSFEVGVDVIHLRVRRDDCRIDIGSERRGNA